MSDKMTIYIKNGSFENN